MMNKNRKLNILLIEDDDVDAMLFERNMERHWGDHAGQIVRARNGVEALQMLDENKVAIPFILVVDLSMPRMGGLEFLTQLRQREQHRDVVAVILTSSSDRMDVSESYKRNVAGYFVKSLDIESYEAFAGSLLAYWGAAHLSNL